jgi:hypothetical protein
VRARWSSNPVLKRYDLGIESILLIEFVEITAILTDPVLQCSNLSREQDPNRKSGRNSGADSQICTILVCFQLSVFAIREYIHVWQLFSVKTSDGVVATSFKKDDKVVAHWHDHFDQTGAIDLLTSELTRRCTSTHRNCFLSTVFSTLHRPAEAEVAAVEEVRKCVLLTFGWLPCPLGPLPGTMPLPARIFRSHGAFLRSAAWRWWPRRRIPRRRAGSSPRRRFPRRRCCPAPRPISLSHAGRCSSLPARYTMQPLSHTAAWPRARGPGMLMRARARARASSGVVSQPLCSRYPGFLMH